MRMLRWLLGALAWILAAVLGLLAVVLCLTIILLPIGVPLFLLARRLFGLAARLMLPPAVTDPTGRIARAVRKRGRRNKKTTAGRRGKRWARKR